MRSDKCSRWHFFLSTACALTLAAVAAAQQPVEPLEGLDPVLLTEGREVDGDPAITLVRGPFRYSFASVESRARFAAEPERFEIQNQGFCARMGAPVVGDPHLFHVHQGRIYVLGSGACHKLFSEAPQKYLEPAAGEALAQRSSAADLARGRELVERAAQALGGKALDDLTGLQLELASPPAPNTAASTGAAEAVTLSIVRYPDRFRLESPRPFGTLLRVATPERSLSGLVGEPPATLTPEQGRELIRLAQRNLLSLLKARSSRNFVAARLGAEQDPARIAVALGRDAFTLVVDPQSGRVQSLAYRGRNGQGEFGAVVESYSDWRAVGGLQLPFAITATWNGEPLPERSCVVRSAIANPTLDAEAFSWPVPKGRP